MVGSSRRAIVREFWKNKIREDADELEHAMIKLIEKKEQQNATLEQSQGSSRRYVDRRRQEGHALLVQDYFFNDPTFTVEIFRRRFRMQRQLFLHFFDALQNYTDYFKWREDATKKKGLLPIQKCTTIIRQLAYASLADSLDEYIRIGERTAFDCHYNFCQCVVDVFGARYLRSPNVDDTQRLIQMHEERHEFPGMLGSLDCMCMEWRNCPVAWKGQYT